MSKKTKKITASERQRREKRRGFNPTLVIATVIVVVFVLWFCPRALMHARIDQTEKRAEKIIRDHAFQLSTSPKTQDDRIQLLPQKKYTDYTFFQSTNSADTIYAIPQYYGKTALDTLCLQDGKIYRKDISGITTASPLPPVDNTWE